MSMSYTSLTGAKGSAGSIMNWVGYSKLDVGVVVDEAQSLLYQMLRVREMRSEWTFGMAVGQANQALPSRFLDPIGRLRDVTNDCDYGHSIESDVVSQRSYETVSGSFGASPFTTTINSALVSVALSAHGLTQDSTLTIAAAAAVGGLTLNGAFPVVTITDANTLVIDAGTEATSSASGGGSSATYTGLKLISGLPSRWSVFDERVKFDVAFDTAATLKLLHYRAPALLSATNTTNWVTTRYPMLLRKACQAAAADYMQDDGEYQKYVQALAALIASTAAENDLIYRGASFGTETP